jgi:integrase
MAKASLYLDLRASKDGSTGPIKVRVYHKGSAFFLPTSINIASDQWMDGVIINHARAKQWNNLLKLRMMDITSELIKLDVDGKLSSMTSTELKKRLLLMTGSIVEADETPANLFWPIFQEYMEAQKNSGTKSIYKQTAARLMAYDLNIERRQFNDIDKTWLQKFDDFMALTAPKRNARNIHLRNVRAVFNYAINEKGLNISYPFRAFKIVAESTASRALTIDQIRQLRSYPISEPHLAKYRDIFMLMTYLRGINAADLFSAKKTDVINGRLEYKRKKTGTFYSIKIEPEAQAIIDKYAGESYLLDVCDTWSNPTDYLRKMDKGLKKIGPMERKGQGGKKSYKGILPDLSSNWARHTYASLGAALALPINIVSEGMGHKIGSPITAIYVHYIRQQVDDATRKIIDYICQ